MSLPRELSWPAATAVVVANMIGTGIFTSTGYLAGDLGSPWLVLAAWLVGGIVALAGAACYAELATAYPESGGEYVYLREIYGPLPAFLSGWVSFVVGFSAPTAAAALAVCAYLDPLIPGLHPETSDPLFTWGPLAPRPGGGQVVAVALIAVLTAVHSLGLRPGARAQMFLTSFKVLVLAGFALLGLGFGEGSLDHLARGATRTATASLPASFAVSLILVMFAYSGFNASAYLGGEVREPRRDLPRSLLAGTALVTLLYLGLNLLFLYALPLDAYVGRINVGEVAAGALFGPTAADFFGLLVAAALLSTVSAMILAGPRVTWAMARRGAFPAWAARVDPRSDVPVRAIALQSGLAAVLAVTGAFLSILIFIGFALSFFAALTVSGLFLHRRRGGGRAGGYRVPLYPLPPLLFCGVCAWMMVHSFLERPGESWAAVAVIAAGAIAFAVRRRPSRTDSG